MTYEQYSPEWLIAHCDVESAFERAVSRQMSRLLAENEALKEKLTQATPKAYTDELSRWVRGDQGV